MLLEIEGLAGYHWHMVDDVYCCAISKVGFSAADYILAVVRVGSGVGCAQRFVAHSLVIILYKSIKLKWEINASKILELLFAL